MSQPTNQENNLNLNGPNFLLTPDGVVRLDIRQQFIGNPHEIFSKNTNQPPYSFGFLDEQTHISLSSSPNRITFSRRVKELNILADWTVRNASETTNSAFSTSYITMAVDGSQSASAVTTNTPMKWRPPEFIRIDRKRYKAYLTYVVVFTHEIKPESPSRNVLTCNVNELLVVHVPEARRVLHPLLPNIYPHGGVCSGIRLTSIHPDYPVISEFNRRWTNPNVS